jgi:DNA-binding transcriptional regulator LsrR (DeoR family)
MYYLDGKDQSQIAEAVGVTRSMVSRMLSEARSRGIVEIRVIRPLQTDYELEQALVRRFKLKEALVVVARSQDNTQLLRSLGQGGAQVLSRHLAPGMSIGLAWGTSISATVEAMAPGRVTPVKVVQLVGAMGARNADYDGHTLVQRLAEKLGGESYYIHAPYFCQTPAMARALLEAQGVAETIALGRQVQVALLGIGSTLPQSSSYYLAGYVPLEEIEQIRASGAVGDIAGSHFSAHGQFVCSEFYERLVTIRFDDLIHIPIRLAVAGGSGKIEPILGALRGGLVNVLVTDSLTARRVLELAE